MNLYYTGPPDGPVTADDLLTANDLPYFDFSLDKGPTRPMVAAVFAIGVLYYFCQKAENRRSLFLSGVSMALLFAFQCAIPTFFSHYTAFLASAGILTLGVAPLIGAWVGTDIGWFVVTGGASLAVASMFLYAVDLSKLQQTETEVFEFLRMTGMPG